MLYDYGMLELWAVGSADWTPVLREEALMSATTSAQDSEPTSTNGAITLAVVTSLLFVSLATLTWGTVKTSEGAIQMNQNSLPVQQTIVWKP